MSMKTYPQKGYPNPSSPPGLLIESRAVIFPCQAWMSEQVMAKSPTPGRGTFVRIYKSLQMLNKYNKY